MYRLAFRIPPLVSEADMLLADGQLFGCCNIAAMLPLQQLQPLLLPFSHAASSPAPQES